MKSNAEILADAFMAKGHDAPLSDKSEDVYRRWPVATAISRVISAAPPKWSTRIGLFGEWGDGKTTVLNFVEFQQKQANNIVIRYSPWGATSEEEIWKEFSSKLLEGLKKEGIKLVIPRLMHWLRCHVSTLSNFVRQSGKGLEASGHTGAVPATQIICGVAEKYLKFRVGDIHLITEQLEGRRVVIFIDDLDRTDPRLVPKLLLSLRELLDLSRFVFVLAFDRKIVAKALSEYHSAMGESGENFLDKVIDLPITLPRPSPEKVLKLAQRRFDDICSFVPKPALQSIAKFLPENPRKLKLFTRMIASMSLEAARHDADELDWSIILLIGLMRAENESFTRELIDSTTNRGNVNWLALAVADSDDKKEQRESRILEMIKKHEIKNSDARMKKMAEEWFQRLPYELPERLLYQMKFVLEPDLITWKEFKFFFEGWVESRDSGRITAFMADRQSSTQQPAEDIQNELLETITSYHGTLLDRASNATGGKENLDFLEQASLMLDLLLDLSVTDKSRPEIDKSCLCKAWEKQLNAALYWCHFNANPGEKELREKEIETLIKLAKIVSDPLELLNLLEPWKAQEADQQLKNGIIERLTNALIVDGVNCALMVYIDTPRGIRKLLLQTDDQAGRYIFTVLASPIFQNDAAKGLIERLRARVGTESLLDDTGDYLDLLLTAIGGCDTMYCTEQERRQTISLAPDLFITLWMLSTSARAQYRNHETYKNRRAKLIAAGMSELQLPVPEWL